MRIREGDVGATLVVLLVVIAIGIFIYFAVAVPYITQSYVNLNVSGKDTYTTTDCSSNSDGRTSCTTYLNNLVYTNGEILKFEDCIVLWRFGSQTDFSHVEIGKTYRFKVYGFDVPWLNWYRTVISYEEI
jgi:hypothetical protein